MSIIRCEKGLHFYDNTKYDTCPHCEQQKERMLNNTMQDQATVAMNQEKISKIDEFVWQTEKQKIRANDYGRTVGYFSTMQGNDYVTGWLVCTDGPERGRDYRLHHGFNRIGRSMNMDVLVADDQEISRDTHCAVVYDAKSNLFYAVPGKGTLTYVNQELLDNPKILNGGDNLQVGKSSFDFIAYCREGHIWEEK